MIIGLTGGIASGKSTVSNYLKEKGFKIYDADKIAKDISEQEDIIKEIVLNFGEIVLGEDCKLDRKKLKEIVFADKKKLEILNKIIHPKVFEFYKNIRNKNLNEIVIFDIPLLFESKMEKLCDKILLITASESIKIERIMKRDNIGRELAKKIIFSQMSDEEKAKKADVVIENNTDIKNLLKKVERFCESI